MNSPHTGRVAHVWYPCGILVKYLHTCVLLTWTLKFMDTLVLISSNETPCTTLNLNDWQTVFSFSYSTHSSSLKRNKCSVQGFWTRGNTMEVIADCVVLFRGIPSHFFLTCPAGLHRWTWGKKLKFYSKQWKKLKFYSNQTFSPVISLLWVILMSAWM